WTVLGLCFFQLGKQALLISQDWSLANQEIKAHQSVIGLKPMIDKALELQKIEQKNKSYDKKNLSNRASSHADKVFPARDYRELDTDERDRYSQHRVRITFQRASYDQVNQFASLIRKESPYMFLSEVKIEPNYPPQSRPYDPTTFDAVFEVSSVEFISQ
ncbi:hypothetical protein N9A58_09690, partial [Opitutales bacterium]|nr:hypothetical protein [Opitutales bacterium]